MLHWKVLNYQCLRDLVSGLDYEVVKAFDINDSANFVYNMIYNCSYASNRSIEVAVFLVIFEEFIRKGMSCL